MLQNLIHLFQEQYQYQLMLNHIILYQFQVKFFLLKLI